LELALLSQKMTADFLQILLLRPIRRFLQEEEPRRSPGLMKKRRELHYFCHFVSFLEPQNSSEVGEVFRH